MPGTIKPNHKAIWLDFAGERLSCYFLGRQFVVACCLTIRHSTKSEASQGCSRRWTMTVLYQ
jgi:hypothetical protein